MTEKQELRQLTGERKRLERRLEKIGIRQGQLRARLLINQAKPLGAALLKPKSKGTTTRPVRPR